MLHAVYRVSTEPLCLLVTCYMYAPLHYAHKLQFLLTFLWTSSYVDSWQQLEHTLVAVFMSATVGRRRGENFCFTVHKANCHVSLSLDLEEDTPFPSHVGSIGKVLSKLESAVCWYTVLCRIAG